MKLINNPDLIKKALSYYESHFADMNEVDEDKLRKQFNIEAKTDLSSDEFDMMLESMETAFKLAFELRENIDYIITNKNTIKLIDRKSQIVTDSRYINGVHEFLEEILSSKRNHSKQDGADLVQSNSNNASEKSSGSQTKKTTQEQKFSVKQFENCYKDKTPISMVDNEGRTYNGIIVRFQQVGENDALMFIENAKFGVYLRNITKCSFTPKIAPMFIDTNSNSKEKVGLKSGDDIFWVNKQLLSERCNYFRAMFLGNFTESSQAIVDLSNSFSAQELQLLLQVLNDSNYDALTSNEATQLREIAGFLVQEDMIKECESLIDKHLDLRQRNFFQAVRNQDYKKITDLLVEGQDINQKFGKYAQSEMDACTFNGPGDTPLTYAVHTQQKDLTAFLLENGADTEAMCRDDTPLMEAAFKHDPELVQLLLEYGANPNLNNGAAMKHVFLGMRDWLLDRQEKPAAQIVRLLFEYGYKGTLEEFLSEQTSASPQIILFTQIWTIEKAIFDNKQKTEAPKEKAPLTSAALKNLKKSATDSDEDQSFTI